MHLIRSDIHTCKSMLNKTMLTLTLQMSKIITLLVSLYSRIKTFINLIGRIIKDANEKEFIITQRIYLQNDPRKLSLLDEISFF